MIEVMKIMVTSFKRSHACTAALSAPTLCRPLPTYASSRDSWTLMGKSGSSLLTIRWWSRRTCTHLLLRELQNYNLLLNNRQQKNVGAYQKKIPHVQGQRRSPSKTVGGAKSHLESNPISARDTRRAQTNLVHTRAQRPHRD